MSFPSFYDINENLNKLLLDYFHFDNLKFKFITKEKLNLEIGTNYGLKSRNLNLDFQSKLKYENVDVILKYISTNMLTLDCQVKNFPYANSGTNFNITNDFLIKYYQAQVKHFKTGKNYHLGADCHFVTSRPIVTFHSLFGYDNYFFGGKVCVHNPDKLEKNPDFDFCIGYSVSDFIFHGSIKHEKSTSYKASVFQKINDNFQCGVKIGWGRATNNVNMTLCTQIDLDDAKQTFVKFKTNNFQTLGFAYGFNFIKGFQIVWNGEFSKSNINFGISSTIDID